MTTIAYRDGILAVDSQITHGEIIMPYSATKFWVLNTHAGVFSGVGDLNEISILKKWLMSAKASPQPEATNSAMFHFTIANNISTVQIWEGAGTYEKTFDNYVAYGSGAAFALGAMAAGANAVEAVKIARSFDVWTGNIVQSINVSTGATFKESDTYVSK
jgi:ATP-dependent protease HslVU (ClpYQ) peptidase subunit